VIPLGRVVALPETGKIHFTGLCVNQDFGLIISSRRRVLKVSNSFTGACLFVLVAATAFVAAPVARGQSAYNCDGGRPFIASKAEHLVSRAPDGTELKQDLRGRMVRDSNGRIYSELHAIRVEPPQTQTQDARSALHFEHPSALRIDSIISISDCHGGKDITVFPELKSARVSKNNNASFWNRKNGVSFFEFLTSGPRPANMMFEDLGLKEVQGVLTHGYRNTILGTQDDGEWNGRVKYVVESWISDDLAETILQIITNLKAKAETRIMLTDITREEPDASLFEIPPGYKIGTAPEEDRPSDTRPESNTQ
jgi:hypothetical protein